MENNMNNYNIILNKIYKYYISILDYVKIAFNEIDNQNNLKIDFAKDFVVYNKKQDGFVVYDSTTNKFRLSIPCGFEKYNNLIKKTVIKNIDIKNKYEKQYYTFFSEEDRALIIKNYKISFIEFIKSEFIHEYFKKIIKIKSTKKYVYDADEFYSEKLGFNIGEIIIELQSRLFSKKYSLFYLPLSIGDDEILRKIKWIMLSNNINVILNDSLDSFLSTMPNHRVSEIIKYEEKQFEKKYNLKENSFEDDRLSNLLYKSIKQRKKELVDSLKSKKEQLTGASTFLENSYGFVNIITIVVIIIFILLLILRLILNK